MTLMLYLFCFLRQSLVAGLGRKCALDECSSNYRLAMEEARIIDPERSPQYCAILLSYRQCQDANTQSCRGDLTFHTTEFLTRKLEREHCPRNSDRSGPSPSKGPSNKPPHRGYPATGHPLRPSCKYFGSFKFRFCSLFGDPHLKTFEGKYQTCRVNGTWALINNSYVSVHVTNRPVVENSAVTAPTKVSVLQTFFFFLLLPSYINQLGSICVMKKSIIAQILLQLCSW